MGTVRENVARVTVSDVADIIRATAKERRREREQTRPRPSSTEGRVHPAALAWALELAGGDRARLRFLPDGSVLVHNHRRHR